jgi:hypothetical protein
LDFCLILLGFVFAPTALSAIDIRGPHCWLICRGVGTAATCAVCQVAAGCPTDADYLGRWRIDGGGATAAVLSLNTKNQSLISHLIKTTRSVGGPASTRAAGDAGSSHPVYEHASKASITNLIIPLQLCAPYGVAAASSTRRNADRHAAQECATSAGWRFLPR